MGSEVFAAGVKARLGLGGDYRPVQDHGVAYSLKQPELAYGGHFGAKIGTLSHDEARSVG